MKTTDYKVLEKSGRGAVLGFFGGDKVLDDKGRSPYV